MARDIHLNISASLIGLDDAEAREVQRGYYAFMQSFEKRPGCVASGSLTVRPELEPEPETQKTEAP